MANLRVQRTRRKASYGFFAGVVPTLPGFGR